MNIALDTNAYSDFMRGNVVRVEIVRAARSIHLPLIVLGELRAGFAAGNRESTNAANLQRFLGSPRVSVLPPDEQTTHHYAQLHLQLRTKERPYPRTISGLHRWQFSIPWCCALPIVTFDTFRRS